MIILMAFVTVRITAGALPRGLHVLNLSKNKISAIEGLRELTRLRILDLSYNKIARIGHGKSLLGMWLLTNCFQMFSSFCTVASPKRGWILP